jgi:hypothetical protein
MQDTTDINGSYQLDVLLSEVQPDWEVKVVKNGSATNGVNALDLVRIQKHLLGLEPFTSPLFLLASDYNQSLSISALDIVGLLKLLLGISNSFPNGESWIVIPADTDFGPPNNHPPAIISYTIPLQSILDGSRLPIFTAVKKGDANGNANPNQ